MNQEEFDLLKKLEKVNAPPNFEQRVLSQLALRRKQLRTRHLRLSLAGAFSAAVVLLIVINIFIFPQIGLLRSISLKKEGSVAFQPQGKKGIREIIPIIEPVNYKNEIQTLSEKPTTIYILEQVSDETSSEINY